ncbi:16S rRNA (cytosine(967)-C(5))-methyltransferase [filamentous cyanobacterium CCP5]|nr:16S rRNA (cytosine(967)-C(5))-methyltransferase [filamentous cyanobacterium CCP5]
MPSTTGSPLADSPARQLAFEALQAIERGAYADVALHRGLRPRSLAGRDRALTTELVYGSVRRQRTLDALIDALGKKTARQQPMAVRLLLRLGLYQLRYLDSVPPSAAVNTTVDLAKANGQGRLSGVVNGILRQYLRRQSQGDDPLQLPADPARAIGIRHSFPDWIVQLWQEQIGLDETAALCDWFNRTPYLDLRVNPLQTNMTEVESAFEAHGIPWESIPHVPQGLRLLEHVGDLSKLPGYAEGWWSVQDASAQLVAYLADPQPGQVIIDACAAPGGKATHLAERMGDRGTIWACDLPGKRKSVSPRLQKVIENAQRLGLHSIKPSPGDSRDRPELYGLADRVLIDAPCSGLGTLHRHADARWRQSPASVAQLTQLQGDLLRSTAEWLKPDGRLIYATCTLNPPENQSVIQDFLAEHSDWRILPPPAALQPFADDGGWIEIWPHRHEMDGFFMVALGR